MKGGGNVLTELCQELHNWFCERDEIQEGNFRIENGTLSLPFLQEGRYYRIVGSVFNDGVHQYGASSRLIDEAFYGSVWPMKIPKAVIDLSEKISDWEEKNGVAVLSPYQSESWGGYSYSLKSGSGDSDSISWQSVFARQLNRWRKIQ